MFQFKQFAVADELCAMKVGTDGVLLGAWADVEGDSRILDIGTGSGLIALMLAQRNAKAEIVALDIDEDATIQAQHNFSLSPWNSRLSVVHSNITDYMSDRKFTHIVSNPPYFVDSLHSPNAARTAARHTSSLPFVDIVAAAERLLEPEGRLSVILPTDVASMFRREAFERLWLTRQLDIVTKAGEPPRRTMMEFCLIQEPQMPRCAAMLMGSEECRELTNDFYL
ncbi:MAG: methyltransferase [Alistipes sp.]|nr:methyltransferase [Alistipes sp.]